MTTSTYSYPKKGFTKRYPTSFVYAEEIEDESIRYKAKEVRKFFAELQTFLEMNKAFFTQFSSIMTHKIKTINPENLVTIQKDGYEYVGDAINIYTTKGVFQIKFDLDEKMK